MNLSKFEKALTSASSIQDLNKILTNFLNKFSIKTFAFTYYSYYPNSQNKLKYDYSTPDFAPWHKHYLAENYEEIDTTLEDVYKAALPQFWDLQQQLKNAKSERERQMRLDSITFGSEKGLSIPIHGPGEDFAILLLVQMRGQKCLESWAEIQYELFNAAYYYYFYLQKLLLKISEPVARFQLSKREIQCLTLVIKQFSPSAIAAKLSITERTVNYHIQRLNKKMGVKNKYQAVIKALQHGLIRL